MHYSTNLLQTLINQTSLKKLACEQSVDEIATQCEQITIKYIFIVPSNRELNV